MDGLRGGDPLGSSLVFSWVPSELRSPVFDEARRQRFGFAHQLYCANRSEVRFDADDVASASFELTHRL